jgi:hypothetical protein
LIKDEHFVKAMSEDCGKNSTVSMIPSSLSINFCHVSEASDDLLNMAGGKRKFSEAEPQTYKLAKLTENSSKRLDSDHIAHEETSDVEDLVKKRAKKAECKKLCKLSDESANLLSPNKEKLGVAAKSAAPINQKSNCSQKPHSEIDAELYQSLMSFR